jgi:hypothetical protein
MERCTGCGSTETIEKIQARSPKALSCCPERQMRPVDPNSVGWWALKDGAYVDFKDSAKFKSPGDAGSYFFDRHGFGVTFHHGNRAGLRATPSR